jgi:lantibiotic modifying enzyme
MTDQVDATFQPGLFQGLAGIGYQCLRLADPQGVPVVLLGA